MTDNRPELSQLRNQLRELGYLDSRIERFFLSDAGIPRPWTAIAENASKLGVTAGPLLAALVLIGQVLSYPELASQTADLVLLALYVMLGASSALGMAGLIVGLTLFGLRRAGFLRRFSIVFWARSAGFVLGAGSLLYLSLWWLERDKSVSLTAFAMFFGGFIAFAVARLTMLASFGVLAAVAPDRRPATRSLSRFPTLRYVLVGAAVYAGLFVGIRPGAAPSRPDSASAYELRDSSLRVRLVGIDGLSLELLNRVRGSTALDGFEQLMARGSHYPYTIEDSRVPVAVWTSLATGQDPSRHGVQSVRVDALVGLSSALPLEQSSVLARALATFKLSEPRPVDTLVRRAKANWDILSDQGRSVGVVGWWASWPADPLRGFLLTDRLFFKLIQSGEFEKETDAEQTYYRLASRFAEDQRRARESLGSVHDQARHLGGDELALALERDAYHLRVSEVLVNEQSPQLQMTYLSGLDIAATKLFVAPSAPVAETVASVDLLQTYVGWIDQRIEDFVDQAGDSDVLIVVAEPGRRADAQTSHGAVFLLGGPVVAQASVRASTPASLYDVTPTVLNLLGFPMSSEMSGRVLSELFSEDYRRANPPVSIETFGAKRIDPSATRSGFDQEMIRQLRSLGYVE